MLTLPYLTPVLQVRVEVVIPEGFLRALISAIQKADVQAVITIKRNKEV